MAIEFKPYQMSHDFFSLRSLRKQLEQVLDCSDDKEVVLDELVRYLVVFSGRDEVITEDKDFSFGRA